MIAARILHKNDLFSDQEYWFDQGFSIKKVFIGEREVFYLAPDKYSLVKTIEGIFGKYTVLKDKR